MASSIPWPEFTPSETPIDVLVKISRFYGSDPDFVLAGGGNTSVKIGRRLLVKGSGHPLATIGPDGFVEMDRDTLETLVNRQLSTDKAQREEQFKTAIMAARVDPQKGQRPSVEALLHHLMPRQYVVHSHSTLVNMYTCCQKGGDLVGKLLGDQVMWVPEVDPGYILSRTLRDLLAGYKTATGRDCPRAVLMQNHGLVICGDSAEEVRQTTDWLVAALRKPLEDDPPIAAFGPITRIDPDRARRLINLIGPSLRGLLAGSDTLKIVAFDDGVESLSLGCGAEGKTLATAGPLTPDQIVYCRSFALWVDPPDDAAHDSPEYWVTALRQAIANHVNKTGAPPQMVLVKGLGLFAAGDDPAGAQTARAVYLDAIKIMAGAQRLGGVKYLDPALRKFIEDWEVEAYRKQIAAASRSAGRAAGKVALVTGAAQGFGLEISQDLADQGACVVLTDINAHGAQDAAAQIGAHAGLLRAAGLPINVTDAASIDQAIHRIVRLYGGLDILISNAGVLKAGSVKTQAEKDFDFVTSVNYKGFFLCVQKVAPLLALQHLACPAYWSDIIQINSKSGLQGSNRNFAYAGSKFGGIGLTQSFALELIDDGIKVNAICPGNFLDGPLWSDPQTGLFAQYLRSGKVPGAKTIADVRRAYEAKVPMRRGCTTSDVMKAIYYVIDQKYETGQALPVTGGQIMLS